MMSSALLVKHKKMYQMALKLLVPLSEQETYKIITEEAQRLVNAKFCSIFLYHDREIKRVYTTDHALYNIIPRKDGATWRVYNTKKTSFRRENTANATTKFHPEFKHLNIRIGSDITVPLIYDHKVFGALSAMSGEKKMFTKKQVEELEMFSPLATLAINNMQLRQKQQKAVEYRDLFISLASHELKTPLTVISIYSELLASDKITREESEKEIKVRLNTEVKKMKKITNELLEIDQIKQGKLLFSMKKCKIATVVAEAVRSFQTSHQQNTIVFKNNLQGRSDVVAGDCDKLAQVVLNLMVNAVKFSSGSKKVIVCVGREKKYVSISVTDFGEGIAPKDLPEIFEQFYRGESKKEGMGLGLYLVKTIIDKHNGKISVDSKINKGTTMTILLPLYAVT